VEPPRRQAGGGEMRPARFFLPAPPPTALCRRPNATSPTTSPKLVDELQSNRRLNLPPRGGNRAARVQGAHAACAALSGAMRWDIQRPWRPLRRPFRPVRRHVVPLVYATLAASRGAPGACGADGRSPLRVSPRRPLALTWEHLLGLRHAAGCPAMPSSRADPLPQGEHRAIRPPACRFAAGEALRLKLAGAGEVKVFVVEGERRFGRPAAAHETKNSAWGLGLSQPGIPRRLERFSASTSGPHRRWSTGRRKTGSRHMVGRVDGHADGMEWGPVTRAVLEASAATTCRTVPRMAWFRTRKGRATASSTTPATASAQAQRPGILGNSQGVHGPLRRQVPGRR